MTRREQAKLMRLEAENRELRQRLNQAMEVSRRNLWEIVEMKTKLELIDMIMIEDKDVSD
jgi:hypothetical protein